MNFLINGVSGVKYDYIEHIVLILGEEGREGRRVTDSLYDIYEYLGSIRWVKYFTMRREVKSTVTHNFIFRYLEI